MYSENTVNIKFRKPGESDFDFISLKYDETSNCYIMNLICEIVEDREIVAAE